MTRMQAERYAIEHNEKSRSGESFVAERVDNHAWAVYHYIGGNKRKVAG